MYRSFFQSMSLLALVVTAGSSASAGVGTEVVKQLAKAAARTVGGEVAEQGGKAAVRKVIERASSEVVEQVGKLGSKSVLGAGGVVDDVANAAWRNKGVITGAAVLGTAVANADAVMAAGADVVESGINTSAENIALPLATSAANQLAAMMWVLLGVALLGALVGLRCYRMARREQPPEVTKPDRVDVRSKAF